MQNLETWFHHFKDMGNQMYWPHFWLILYIYEYENFIFKF